MEFFHSISAEMTASLSWRSALDTLFIGAGLYILYRTFRSSGSQKAVAGTLIAGIVFIAANFLDLEGIRWIYSNLSSIILIALVVVFQPELRKIFERTASLYRRTEDSAEELADILPQAVFELASRKWGGLIVLPGAEHLGSHLSGGIEADAACSYSLLMSIFDPHSPGHDGACIMQNGRIHSFGVRLPISDSNRLPSEYGTRHHAAMGLSEASDSLVILISEERGRASFFRNGMMHPLLEKDDLRQTVLLHQQNLTGTKELFKLKKSRRVIFLEMLSIFVLAFFIRFFMIETHVEPKTFYKNAQVQAQLIGELKDGITLKRIIVTPSEIRIMHKPPDREVVLKTSPVYLENIRTDARLHVPLLPPPGVHPVLGFWPEAEVLIEVASEEIPADADAEKNKEAAAE